MNIIQLNLLELKEQDLEQDASLKYQKFLGEFRRRLEQPLLYLKQKLQEYFAKQYQQVYILWEKRCQQNCKQQYQQYQFSKFHLYRKL